jgi:hypothetical protein
MKSELTKRPLGSTVVPNPVVSLDVLIDQSTEDKVSTVSAEYCTQASNVTKVAVEFGATVNESVTA